MVGVGVLGWSPHTAKQFWTSARCPTIQLNYDIIYLETASDSTGSELGLQDSSHIQMPLTSLCFWQTSYRMEVPAISSLATQYRCQLQTQAVTCISDQLVIHQGFPRSLLWIHQRNILLTRSLVYCKRTSGTARWKRWRRQGMRNRDRASVASLGTTVPGHHVHQSRNSPNPICLGILWQLHYISMMTKPLVVVLISQSSLTFFHPMDYVACQASLRTKMD